MKLDDLEILRALDDLDHFLRTARGIPLSHRVAVNLHQLQTLIEQVVSAMPGSYKQARLIINEREEILADKGFRKQAPAAEPFVARVPEPEPRSVVLLIDDITEALDPKLMPRSSRVKVDAVAAREAMSTLRSLAAVRINEAELVVTERDKILAAARRGERIGPWIV